MSVLVLGSTGMVGSAVSNEFASAGYEVKGIGRDQLNLEDGAATTAYFQKIKPKIVICAAAKVGGILKNNENPYVFLSSNLLIQVNSMEAARNVGVEKLIFLGSSCIYPKLCKQPIKEEYLLSGPLEETNSAYALAKIAGIEAVKAARRQFGLKWISIMPSNLYGPRDNFHSYSSHVLPALIRRFSEAVALGTSEVTLWGSGKPLREFTHVEDFARAVLIATERYDSEIQLHVGSGEECSINDLAKKISEAAGFKGRINWDTSKPDGTPRKVLDSKSVRSLGWTPNISLEKGIETTLLWYQEAVRNGQARI